MSAAGKYDHLSHESLVKLLERRDAERRYGLVWEREGIEPDRALNDDFVALDLDVGLSTPPGEDRGWRNLVIEGDNWDALRALRLAYAGRIRCILIDPPYNTGAQDFIYNDRFVGAQDRYRQSLWLEFLYRRLIVARDLLSDDGVILVCMNDDNRARLELLMEQVFPGMRIGSFVWRTRTAGGGTGDRNLSVDHEHVLIFANKDFAFGGIKKSFAMYRQEDDGGKWQPVSLAKRENWRSRPNSYYPLYDPSSDTIYPCNPDRVWAFVRREHLGRRSGGQSSIEDLIDRGRVIFPDRNRVEIWPTLEDLKQAIRSGDVPKAGNGALLIRGDLPNEVLSSFVGRRVGWGTPRYKLYVHEVKSTAQPVSSLIADGSAKNNRNALQSGTNAEGTKTLRAIFGKDVFSYPKPVSLMQSLIKACCNGDDIVLDFFAGSATVAQAVLSANYEDDGRRRFIMVSSTEATPTDPEKNLCRDVCAERIRRVISGYADNAGFDSDFAYLRTRGIPWDDVLYDFGAVSIWILIQLRYDRAILPFDDASAVQVSLPVQEDTGSPALAFVPQVTKTAVEQLRTLASVNIVAVFTPAPGNLRDLLDMPNVAIEQVPDRLLAEFPRQMAGL